MENRADDSLTEEAIVPIWKGLIEQTFKYKMENDKLPSKKDEAEKLKKYEGFIQKYDEQYSMPKLPDRKDRSLSSIYGSVKLW